MMRNHIALIGLFLLSSVGWAQTAFVLDISGGGQWFSSQTGKPVMPQQSLYTGEKLRAATGSPEGASLTLVFYGSKHERRTLNCHKGHCDAFDLPKATEGTWFAKTMESLQQLTGIELVQKEYAIVRGLHGPREAVLFAEDGQVDLTPALSEIESGKYFWKIAQWRIGEKEPGAALTGALTWNPSTGTIVQLPKPTTGFYRLALRMTGEPTTQVAYVLVASSVDYEQKRLLFKRFCQETELDMPKDGAARAKEEKLWRELRVRYLMALDRGLPQSGIAHE
jgi:hypothetical protein